MKALIWRSIIMAGFKFTISFYYCYLHLISCYHLEYQSHHKIAFYSWTFISWSLLGKIDSSRNNLEPLSQQQNKVSPTSSKSSVTSAELYDGFSSSSSVASGAPSARFLTPNGTLITAQRGTPASLPCEVVSLGDGVVSYDWSTHLCSRLISPILDILEVFSYLANAVI